MLNLELFTIRLIHVVHSIKFIVKCSKFPITVIFLDTHQVYVSETIPLIDWGEVIKTPAKRNKALRRIGTTVAVSPKSFALKVNGNSLVVQSGNEVSFREEMIVIVDPQAEIKPNSFVVASTDKTICFEN